MVREVGERRDWKEWEAPRNTGSVSNERMVFVLESVPCFQGQKAFCVDLRTVDLLPVFRLLVFQLLA